MSLDLFDLRQNRQYGNISFTSFSGHRPARRECARTRLRSHARYRPCSIPPPVKVGHTTGGIRPLLFSNSDVGSFTYHKNESVKVLWDGTHGFSPLSEKTRKSKHLKMSLQRQHFGLQFGLNIRREGGGRGPPLDPPLGFNYILCPLLRFWPHLCLVS